MSTTYDKAYFIAKFSAIRPGKIITEMLNAGHGQRCALGHCKVDDIMHLTDEAKALERLLGANTALINNGYDDNYQQPTPKARILAALADLKP